MIVHRVSRSWVAFLPKFLMILSLFGMLLPALSLDNTLVGEGFAGEHKHKLETVKTEHYWHTAPFRPIDPSVLVNQPINFERSVLCSGELLQYGGVIVAEDERQKIEDANDIHWRIYGQLTMCFGDKTYTDRNINKSLACADRGAQSL